MTREQAFPDLCLSAVVCSLAFLGHRGRWDAWNFILLANGKQCDIFVLASL